MNDPYRLPEDAHPDLWAFLEYWNRQRGDRRFPRRIDIEPSEIPKLLHGICILDIEYDSDQVGRVRFRLAGTQLYEMIGFEVTGRYVDEIMSPEIYPAVREQFDWMVKVGEPAYRQFHWRNGPMEHVLYERVMAPLGEPNQLPGQLIGMHAIVSEQPLVPSSQRELSLPIG